MGWEIENKGFGYWLGKVFTATLVIGFMLFCLVFAEWTYVGAQEPTKQPHEFSIIDYNKALTAYEKGNYAIAFNLLLESNAPVSAYTAFGIK